MKQIFVHFILICAFSFFTITSHAQPGTFSSLTISGGNPENFIMNGGAANLFGWGNNNYDNSLDPRPNPHPTIPTYFINHHTGLTFSAHSYYGGIRFYNQGYPNGFSTTGGAIMAMAITSGSVGIGTTTPDEKLHIHGGNVYINSTTDMNHIYWAGHEMSMGTKVGDYSHNIFKLEPGGSTQGELFSAFNMYNSKSPTNHELKVQLHTNGNSYLNGGNVGIGTSTPTEKLSVNGNIRSKEVKVETSNWPDYVFKKDYNLMPLSQVKTFINKNHHLPEIPSAAEVEKNGISLGEMNRLLTKKLEELTLHLIEKEDQLHHQSSRLDNLEAELRELQDKKGQ